MFTAAARILLFCVLCTISSSRLDNICCEALGKVLKHSKSKLKELILTQNELNDDEMRLLCDVLSGNSTIKRLSFDHNNYRNKRITSDGWQALSTVICHPDCKLIELGLINTGINDEGVDVLGSALGGLSSLKVLYLVSNKSISRAGWHKLLNQLSQSSIEKLGLGTIISMMLVYLQYLILVQLNPWT